MPIYIKGTDGSDSNLSLLGISGGQQRFSYWHSGQIDADANALAGLEQFLRRVTVSASTSDSPANKSSTRSPTERATPRNASTWTVVGSPLVCLAIGETHVGVGFWRPPRPWAAPVIFDTEQFGLDRPFRAQSCKYGWDEDAPISRDLVRPTRRPRRNGLYHYANHKTYRQLSKNGYPKIRMSWCVYYDTRPWRHRITHPQNTSSSTLTLLTLAVTLTLTPAMTRVVGRPLAATEVLSPAISNRITVLRSLAAALTLIAAQTRTLFKAVPVGLTLTALFQRKQFKAISSSLSLTAVVSFTKQQARQIAATLNMTSSASLVAMLKRTLSASETLTAALVRKQFKALSASETLTASLSFGRFYLRTLSATLTITAAIAIRRTIQQALSASLFLTAAQGARFLGRRAIGASLALTTTLTRRLSQPLSAGVVLTGDMDVHKGNRVVNLTLAASTILTAALKSPKFAQRTLAASIVLVPALIFKVYSYTRRLFGSTLGETRILDAKADDTTIMGDSGTNLMSAERRD